MQSQSYRSKQRRINALSFCLSVPLCLALFAILTSTEIAFAQNKPAVDRALNCLAKAQNPDGSFGTVDDINRRSEITSVCLLAFASDGDAPDLGKFGSATRLATAYLINCASSPKLSPESQRLVLFALSQIVGIDDNAQDLVRISQLLQNASSNAETPPFSAGLADSWSTLVALFPQKRWHVPDQLSYSLLYRLALGAVAIHWEDLSAEIDHLLLSRQRRDGSWDGDIRSTGMAVLALTCGDQLLRIGG